MVSIARSVIFVVAPFKNKRKSVFFLISISIKFLDKLTERKNLLKFKKNSLKKPGFSTDICNNKLNREDSSASDECDRDSNTVTFVLGDTTSDLPPQTPPIASNPPSQSAATQRPIASTNNALVPVSSSVNAISNLRQALLQGTISQPIHMNSFDR